MKIVQINSVLNWGSTGKIAEQIGTCVIESGNSSFVVYGRDKGPIKTNSTPINISSKLGQYLHIAKSFLFDSHGLGSKTATNKMILRLKQIKPDIVHIHNIHGYYINYPMLFNYLRESNIPLVWTMHDCWGFTGHCTYFDMVNCDKWKTICCNCPNISDYPKALFDNSKNNFVRKQNVFTSLQNVTLVPVSNWLGNLVAQSFMGKYPIKVIHNGIDLSVFRIKNNNLRSQLNLEGKKVVLGVSSNGFSGRKGLTDFHKLANVLPSSYQIIMIGLSEEEMKSLPQNIIGLKRTTNVEELVDYYNIADVFINPTYSDNFPTTNIEALACGTPVITYNTGGSPEAIDDFTGYVVQRGNIGDLKNAIEIIGSEFGKIKEQRQEYCRKRAVEHFNKNERFNDYVKLYQRILNE